MFLSIAAKPEIRKKDEKPVDDEACLDMPQSLVWLIETIELFGILKQPKSRDDKIIQLNCLPLNIFRRYDREPKIQDESH